MFSKNLFTFKLLGIVFVIINIIIILASINQFVILTAATTQGWTNCTPVSGNTNQPLTNVDVSTTDTSYIPAFLQELVGMYINQPKSFVIPASEGYSTGQLAGQNLYFDVTITNIDSPSGATVVNNGDVVNLVYSLWIDCPAQGSGTTAQSNTGANTVPVPNNFPLYIGGGVILLGILATIGFTVIRKSNTFSSETIQKTQIVKEQKNLNQIKNIIDQKKEISSDQEPTKTDNKRTLSSRPRRR